MKNVAHIVSRPLADIFNLSLSTGSVPEQLKIAKVIPIYKKENAEIFSNYCPVSVLPYFSKILERLVFNRCMDYIDNNNLLNEKQFGFRPNHSTLESCGARFLAPRPRIAPLSFAPTRTGLKNSKFCGPDPGPTRLYFPRTGPDRNNLASTRN